MEVKRFKAADMHRALVMVRETMGNDAIILSNRKIPGGIEVCAALDPATVPVAAKKRDAHKAPANKSKLEQELEKMQRESRQKAKDIERQLHMTRKPPATKRAPSMAENALDHYENRSHSSDSVEQYEELQCLREELQSMRGLLERQLHDVTWNAKIGQSPILSDAYRRLLSFGISTQVARRLIQLVGDVKDTATAWKYAMGYLSSQLPVMPDTLQLEGGVYALVGPTGSGKTTSIGKLAARYVMEYGADEVALISTDTYRVAAHEQLRAFGRILDIPVKILPEGGNLAEMLRQLRRKSLILIDTAGLSPGSTDAAQQLQALADVSEQVTTLLTISATSQAKTMQTAYHQYSAAELDGCLISKIDEAVSLGEALSFTLEKRLPIAYISDGQQIPDDIYPVDVDDLIERALRCEKRWNEELDLASLTPNMKDQEPSRQRRKMALG
ncbi:MAG TPA: flagellar biosynthesis protein FlhF [Pseudomonadales bacterium]|nr:flagellar biosynthesis protein FlhF [Pseudomonadales bacterium]